MVAPAVIAAGISAGGSLLGGLLGGGDESETKINYKALRRDAEHAGFNPLTALRAGGGAGFTTTHHPALASGQFIADAMTGLGNMIAQIDPMRDATAKLEHDIKVATLANIQADTAARLHATRSINGAPVSTGARNVVASSALSGKPLTPTVERPTLTNPHTGTGLEINPAWVDAEAWEQRYGEIVGGVFAGGVNAAADAVHNVKRFEPPKGGIKHGPDWTQFSLPSLATPKGASAPWRPPSLPANRGW